VPDPRSGKIQEMIVFENPKSPPTDRVLVSELSSLAVAAAAAIDSGRPELLAELRRNLDRLVAAGTTVISTRELEELRECKRLLERNEVRVKAIVDDGLAAKLDAAEKKLTVYEKDHRGMEVLRRSSRLSISMTPAGTESDSYVWCGWHETDPAEILLKWKKENNQ
jgi:hypothetical protein